jgi:hypothetical protein
MDASLKPILRSISLALRHELEGWRDEQNAWQPGDLERRLNELGVWSDRPSKPLDEMRHLSAEDRAARVVVDGYLQLRSEAGVGRASAFSEFVRESAYTWANRLLALRCMEARGIIDEVILQKAAYSGRSLVHQRFLRKNPEAATGEDDGLFAVLFAEFSDRSAELPALFDPHSAAVALRPSAAALKNCVALLSGTEVVRGQTPASDEVFTASDAFGWAYQYWNTEEKSRVFEAVRTKKGTKIEGADIIPATQLYTEPYMVKFLIQNSLGALWMSLNPESRLCEAWEYYVKDADRAPVSSLMANRSVREFTILDPALGSGHFHLEAFDLLFAMYREEDPELSPREIAASILNNNLFGIDLDERAIQIAEAALWMKAKDVASDLEALDLNNFHEHLVATNIRLPRGRNHLEAFLKEHPEDSPLRPALERVFQGLEHADELGSLLQIEEPVDHELRRLKQEADRIHVTPPIQGEMFEPVAVQSSLPLGLVGYDEWKTAALDRLKSHFEQEAEAADSLRAFFGASARKGLALFDLLARRYDVVTANPPYLGSKNMGPITKRYIQGNFPKAKRDVYLAFILRSAELAGTGRIGLVTQQGWMFLKQIYKLREQFLDSCSLELIGHLGVGAFEEISGAQVNVSLFLAGRVPPSDTHRVTAIRATSAATPIAKAEQLIGGCSAVGAANRFRVAQSELRKLPTRSFVYWCSIRFLRLLQGLSPIDRFGYVGYTASANSRFIRYAWETASHRWVAYSKGGGFQRWAGLEHFVVDWEHSGGRAGSYVRDHYAPDKYTLWLRTAPTDEPTLVWSEIGSGSLGARLTHGRSVISRTGPGIFPRERSDAYPLIACLNTHIVTYLLRLACSGLHFAYPYVAKTACPQLLPNEMGLYAQICIALRRYVLASIITEPSFSGTVIGSRSADIIHEMAAEAALLTFEAALERLTGDAYELDSSDIQAVASETGKPAGFHRLLRGYDATPNSLREIAMESDALADLVKALPRSEMPESLAGYRATLSELFKNGPGTKHINDEDETDEDEDEDDEGDEDESIGAYVPIPTEGFLGELSQKLELHPISVYWLLKEGIEKDGWRCIPEEKRLIEDRFTLLVLRMLGRQWPKELNSNEPPPLWVDLDGVIPLSSGSNEPSLATRVIDRLSDEFPGANPSLKRSEFQEIVGARLENWLTDGFFTRHITQFKKRPIAWQIQSQPQNPRGRRRSALTREPIFACLLYYHRLDADLLPKLRSQYLGVLKIAFDTEHRTLESLKQPTPEQLARKAELDVLLEELNQFDAQLQVVVESGFGPAGLQPRLRQIAVDDALLSMKSRWLARLAELLQNGEPQGAGSALQEWQQAASDLDHHEEFADWIANAVAHLPHHCATAGVKSLDVSEVPDDPTPATVAELICSKVEAMTEAALTDLCAEWRKQHEIHVIRPLKDLIATATTQLDQLAAELESMDRRDVVRVETITREQKRLKADVKLWKKEIKDKTDAVSALAVRIRHWTSPEPSTWESWLASTAMFDEISSLDGRRPAPTTIRDFVQQESLYAPDLNDGVRVNIAPLQRAGLLAAEVLAAKDLDKAIADRAEWRADERRWVREGKLPQPGWWQQQNEEVSA